MPNAYNFTWDGWPSASQTAQDHVNLIFDAYTSRGSYNKQQLMLKAYDQILCERNPRWWQCITEEDFTDWVRSFLAQKGEGLPFHLSIKIKQAWYAGGQAWKGVILGFLAAADYP